MRPRSRWEATSGAVPLANRVASSAQRASWKEWRRFSPPAARLAAARTGPWAPSIAARAAAAVAIGSASPASTTAQTSSWRPACWVATRAWTPCALEVLLQRDLGAVGVGRREDQGGRAVADAERSQPVAHVLGPHAPREGRVEDLAREPALGVARHALAHQLQRDDDRGLLHAEPLEVAELAGAAHHDEPGLGVSAARRNWMGECPAAQLGGSGDERRRGRPAALDLVADRLAELGAEAPAAVGQLLPAGVQHQPSCRRPPARSRARSRPSPPPSRTRRSSRSLTAIPRESTSYCSLTRRLAAASVIWMNGTL